MLPTAPEMSVSRLQALCLLLWLLPCLYGCFAPRAHKSKWPPADFFVQVETGENTVDGIFQKQKAQIWRDGLVVYQEAVPPQGNPLDPRYAPLTSKEVNAPGLPVYKSVCAYWLAPESIRMLSRMLSQTSIKDIPATVGNVSGGEGAVLKMLYRRDGNPQEIMVYIRIFGPMNRVLHVLNSFLPEGHGFTMPEMVGMPEEAHVVEVPPVAESVEGALGFHRKMLEMKRFSEAAAAKDPLVRKRRYQLQRETFALACVHGDIPVAEQLLRAMVKVLENHEKAKLLFPDVEKADSVDHLRQILAAAKHGARPVTSR